MYDVPGSGLGRASRRFRAESHRPVKGVAIFCVILILLYLLLFSEWFVVRPFGSSNVTYYDELADAFRAGQLYLLRAPSAAMLALPDPWDPKANAKFRGDRPQPGQRFKGVHDLTLYHGKFYVQWGPFPALVLIPLQWIVGGDPPMGRLVLVVETLAALLYAAAAMCLRKMARIPGSPFIDLVTVPLFFFCPIWVFLLRRIAVYETAVYFAQLCTSAALLSVVVAIGRRVRRKPGAIWLLGWGSLCLGLAINCRPDIAPLGLMLPIVLYIWWRAGAERERLCSMISPSLALGGPATALLIAALAYNAVRLGNPFDVGIGWQLWGGTESAWRHKLAFTEVARIIPNIWYYFLSPVEIRPAGSWTFQPTWCLPDTWMSPELLKRYGDYTGWSSGLFVTMPTTMLALLFPLLLFRRFGGVAAPAFRATALLMLSGFFGGILPFMAPSVMRYGAEWCMWWVLAGTLMAAHIRSELQASGSRVARTLFDLALVASTAWSIWVGISFLLGPTWPE